MRFASCRIYPTALISSTNEYLHGFLKEDDSHGFALAGYFYSYFRGLFGVAFYSQSL